MDMYFKFLTVVWMVLLSGSLFSQQRLENNTGSEPVTEWRLTYEEQQITESPEYNRWKLNLDYGIKLKKNFRCSFLTLSNLARAAECINEQDNEAFECLNSLLVKNEKALAGIDSEFEAITAQANGIVRWQPQD